MELRAGRQAPVDDAHERDDAPVLVVRVVEHQRARRRVDDAVGRGDPLDDGVEHLIDVDPVFAEMRTTSSAEPPRSSTTSDAAPSGICGRQVDLVDDGDDLEVVLDREVGVGERLRLDPLRGVDDEDGALARLERARDLVREVHVPRRVDEVELVALPVDAHRLCLDRDPALALELHRVEQLVAHLALGDGLRQLEDPVRERRLPVVDVGDDREVADPALVHG